MSSAPCHARKSKSVSLELLGAVAEGRERQAKAATDRTILNNAEVKALLKNIGARTSPVGGDRAASDHLRCERASRLRIRLRRDRKHFQLEDTAAPRGAECRNRHRSRGDHGESRFWSRLTAERAEGRITIDFTALG